MTRLLSQIGKRDHGYNGGCGDRDCVQCQGDFRRAMDRYAEREWAKIHAALDAYNARTGRGQARG